MDGNGRHSGVLTDDDWEAMYCELITHTGWTREYIRRYVTLKQAYDLFAHWGKNPPLQRMLATILGYQQKPSKPPSIEEINEFIPAQTVSADEFDQLLQSKPYFLH